MANWEIVVLWLKVLLLRYTFNLIANMTIILTTRGRYHTTLPLCLMSIINQTRLPSKLILVDDNEIKEFESLEIYKKIKTLFIIKNIEFVYLCGESKGQTFAQQKALNIVDTEWVFSMDDDNVLENDTLEILMKSATENTGAIGCIILKPKEENRTLIENAKIYNKIENIYSDFNIQMIKTQSPEIKKAEHLYSCYLFRKSAANNYHTEYAPAGHRSETVFTYNIFLNGWDVLVNPNTTIWHLDDDKGGNRLHVDNKNEKLFINQLIKWGVIPNKLQLFNDGKITYMMKNGIKYLISV